MDYPRDTDNLKEATSYNGWKIMKLGMLPYG